MKNIEVKNEEQFKAIKDQEEENQLRAFNRRNLKSIPQLKTTKYQEEESMDKNEIRVFWKLVELELALTIVH